MATLTKTQYRYMSLTVEQKAQVDALPEGEERDQLIERLSKENEDKKSAAKSSGGTGQKMSDDWCLQEGDGFAHYPDINTIFKRGKGNVIIPEELVDKPVNFADYLDLPFRAEEKWRGMNYRIILFPESQEADGKQTLCQGGHTAGTVDSAGNDGILESLRKREDDLRKIIDKWVPHNPEDVVQLFFELIGPSIDGGQYIVNNDGKPHPTRRAILYDIRVGGYNNSYQGFVPRAQIEMVYESMTRVGLCQQISLGSIYSEAMTLREGIELLKKVAKPLVHSNHDSCPLYTTHWWVNGKDIAGNPEQWPKNMEPPMMEGLVFKRMDEEGRLLTAKLKVKDFVDYYRKGGDNE